MFIKLAVILILIAPIAVFIFVKRAQLKTFYEEVAFEMTKVTWPSQEEVINCTLLVGVCTVILTVMVGIVDQMFSMIIKMMY